MSKLRLILPARNAITTPQPTRIIEIQDQRENARRESEDDRIAYLEGQEKEDAVFAENERRRRYNEGRFQQLRVANNLQLVERQPVQ